MLVFTDIPSFFWLNAISVLFFPVLFHVLHINFPYGPILLFACLSVSILQED